MAAILLLLLFADGKEGDLTSQGSTFVLRVDLIVINRINESQWDRDAWERDILVRDQSRAYVSFWERPRATLLPITPICHRGWRDFKDVRGIYRSTEGWVVEFEDGLNVEAARLEHIDSPYDWEMQNRDLYIPITEYR